MLQNHVKVFVLVHGKAFQPSYFSNCTTPKTTKAVLRLKCMMLSKHARCEYSEGQRSEFH